MLITDLLLQALVEVLTTLGVEVVLQRVRKRRGRHALRLTWASRRKGR